MSMRFHSLLILWLSFTLPVCAQVQISEFLRSAYDAVEVKTSQEQVAYLKTKPYKLSPLQKLEFRTQVREMSLEKQEYALRMQPANPWEIKSNNQYFRDYQTFLSTQSQLALKEALVERYGVMVDYIFYSELKQLAEEQVVLIEKQLAVLERQSASSFFDADEYVDLKIEHLEEVTEQEDASFGLLNQISVMNQLYPMLSGRTIELDWKKLISVERMERVLDSLKAKEVSSLLIVYRQQKLNLDNSRYKLEKSNMNVGYLQAEYDERRVEQDRVPYNIGLGITIPITNPNKGDMARQKLNAIEAEYELKQEEKIDRLNKENSYARAREMIQHYHLLKKKIDEMMNSELAKNLSNVKGGDPRIRIRYESSINKLHVVEAKLKRKIYNCYIDYLAVSDYLQQAPLINFLTNTLAPISSP